MCKLWQNLQHVEGGLVFSSSHWLRLWCLTPLYMWHWKSRSWLVTDTINSCAKSAWYAHRQHSYNICIDFLSHNSWMKNLNFTISCTISTKLKKNHIDFLNDRKIIGCRKNILSIFVALLTFYNKEKKEENKSFIEYLYTIIKINRLFNI
jgi:hypothetical protein